MKLLRLYLILTFFVLINLYSQTKLLPEGLKITSEKWYQWNDSTWTIDQWDWYWRNSSGVITYLKKYYFDSSGSQTNSCSLENTVFSNCYELEYFYSGMIGHESLTERIIYTYDLNDLMINSRSFYDFSAGGYYDINTNYTYENNQLIYSHSTNDYDYAYYRVNEITETNYIYDEFGRIKVEIADTYKKTSIAEDTILTVERTQWTYKNNIGRGLTEIYENESWIISSEKIRTLDDSFQTITEERHLWNNGEWVNDEKDYLYYDDTLAKVETLPEKYLTETLTFKYNHELSLYQPYKSHNIFYEYFNLDPLLTPTNITSTISGTQLTLTWGAVSGATSYLIYSSPEPNGTFVIDNSGTFSGSTWTTSISTQRKFYRISAIR